MKHINRQEESWAYDRWCEGYTYHQIAEALGVTWRQVKNKLEKKPRIRPILHYTPKGEENNAKEIIMEMATYIVNAKAKYNGSDAFSEEQKQRYGIEALDSAAALFNAGYRRVVK
jgi:predicted transcriptional regulator